MFCATCNRKIEGRAFWAYVPAEKGGLRRAQICESCRRRAVVVSLAPEPHDPRICQNCHLAAADLCEGCARSLAPEQAS
jgi:hypothetical protein